MEVRLKHYNCVKLKVNAKKETTIASGERNGSYSKK